MRRVVHLPGIVTRLEVIEKPYVDLLTRQMKEKTVIPYLSAPPL
jgi:hypothetical protein